MEVIETGENALRCTWLSTVQTMSFDRVVANFDEKTAQNVLITNGKLRHIKQCYNLYKSLSI